MRKWDVTTEKGRDELERFLMRQMGWQYGLDPHSYSPAWFGEIDGKRWVMPKGWVFGPTGMVTLKRLAAEHKRIHITSQPVASESGVYGYAQASIPGNYGAYRPDAKGPDEPTAVALVLAMALEELEGST